MLYEPHDDPGMLSLRIRALAIQFTIAWSLEALGDAIAEIRGWKHLAGREALQREAIERFGLGYQEAMSLSAMELDGLFKEEAAEFEPPPQYRYPEVREALFALDRIFETDHEASADHERSPAGE